MFPSCQKAILVQCNNIAYMQWGAGWQLYLLTHGPPQAWWPHSYLQEVRGGSHYLGHGCFKWNEAKSIKWPWDGVVKDERRTGVWFLPKHRMNITNKGSHRNVCFSMWIISHQCHLPPPKSRGSEHGEQGPWWGAALSAWSPSGSSHTLHPPASADWTMSVSPKGAMFSEASISVYAFFFSWNIPFPFPAKNPA